MNGYKIVGVRFNFFTFHKCLIVNKLQLPYPLSIFKIFIEFHLITINHKLTTNNYILSKKRKAIGKLNFASRFFGFKKFVYVNLVARVLVLLSHAFIIFNCK
jgi:hypothetical protein